ncbi:hypothetical protein QQZ08_000531 [Neonectria magnoliae]|uniref:2EXR domain-containing protein n=1 Tax=Neonectria magnoliae TaxID=2732573 RepID=A0ABR1IHJ0_9HYPO
MTTTYPLFTLFSELPPELRNRIWREVLPEQDGPALYPFRTGCWRPRHLSASDEGYDAHAGDNVILKFHYDLLKGGEVDVPLFFVSREARSIALGWLREQNIRVHFDKDGQCFSLTRPFDSMRDTLYIADSEFSDFCTEGSERLFEPDLVGLLVSSGPNLRRLAVSQGLLKSDAASLNDIFDWFGVIAVVFVIIDRQPRFVLDDMQVQSRWELDSTKGRGFAWDLDAGNFEWAGGESIGDNVLDRQIEEAGGAIGLNLKYNANRSYELPAEFMDALPYLRCFSKISALHLRFDEFCGDDSRERWGKPLRKRDHFGTESWIQSVTVWQVCGRKNDKFKNDENADLDEYAPKYPDDDMGVPFDHAMLLKELTIKVLSLSSLVDLKLFTTTEVDTAAPENAVYFEEKYEMFERLPYTWLSPSIAGNLQVLSLYFEEFWGCHQLQIEWLASVGQKNGSFGLEELYLDNCPIVFEVRQMGPLDSSDPGSPDTSTVMSQH